MPWKEEQAEVQKLEDTLIGWFSGKFETTARGSEYLNYQLQCAAITTLVQHKKTNHTAEDIGNTRTFHGDNDLTIHLGKE